MNLPKLIDSALAMPQITKQSFGEWFVGSKYARPYRHKSRKARTNFRSGNKKKIHQFIH